MSEESKLNDSVVTPQQEKESKKFINIKLNELIDAQRKIFDNNSMEIFYLSEAFTITNIKNEFHNNCPNGIMTEEQFDNIIATYMASSTVGKFLEPMIEELYSEFAQSDINKLNNEQDNENKEAK